MRIGTGIGIPQLRGKASAGVAGGGAAFDPAAVANLAFWNPLTGAYSGASVPNVGGNMSAFAQADPTHQGAAGTATLNGVMFNTLDFAAQQFLDGSGFTTGTPWTAIAPVRFPSAAGWGVFSGGDPASARLFSFQNSNHLFSNNVGNGAFTLDAYWHLCMIQWVAGDITIDGGAAKGLLRVFWDGVLDGNGAQYDSLDLSADATWEINCFRQVAAAAAQAEYGPPLIANGILSASDLAGLVAYYNTHNGFAVPLPVTGRRLVFQGDSNINGSQVALTWANGMPLSGSLANYTRSNFGQGGQAAAGGGFTVSARFGTIEAAQLHPDPHLIYVLAIGTNDQRFGASAATTETRLKQCIAQARQLLPGAQLVCATIPPQNGTFDDAAVWASTQAVNADMRTNAGGVYGDYILDLAGRYVFAGTSNPAIFQDGLHFSLAEQASIATWALPQLQALAS